MIISGKLTNYKQKKAKELSCKLPKENARNHQQHYQQTQSFALLRPSLSESQFESPMDSCEAMTEVEENGRVCCKVDEFSMESVVNVPEMDVGIGAASGLAGAMGGASASTSGDG